MAMAQRVRGRPQGGAASRFGKRARLEAAVGAVRSLMFLGRFRADIQRRMEALES
jgi:hypothetical protein